MMCHVVHWVRARRGSGRGSYKHLLDVENNCCPVAIDAMVVLI
jgi:hypothetical protein